MACITIIRHTSGEFIVYNERNGNRFATLDGAKAHASQLQAGAGGPNRAEIVIIDLPPRKWSA